MLTAQKSYERIVSRAEAIKSDDHHRVETMSTGDAWRQGDVYLVALRGIPAGVQRVDKPELQLAPGTTQGSRHCVESLAGIKIYRAGSATPLDGPIIDAPQGCRVNHPEHGDVSLPPGIYGVVYQRAYAEELRRVQD